MVKKIVTKIFIISFFPMHFSEGRMRHSKKRIPATVRVTKSFFGEVNPAFFIVSLFYH